MERPIGKYVTYREEYLRENKPETYAKLIESGEINAHLDEISRKAHEMKESTIEKLKAESTEWQDISSAEGEFDFLTKTRLLNSFEQQADEIVLAEIIYR